MDGDLKVVSHPCKRVLVVEDDGDLLASISEFLVMEGIEPMLASTGDEALEALRRGPLPDVILLDLGMPGVSGTELLERLKEEDAWRAIPVAAMSGFARDHFQYLPTPDEYLEKPFDLERLNAALCSLCRRRGEAPSAETAAG
jgi:two-component system, chemotaxis family, chemotaxis protein CheY